MWRAGWQSTFLGTAAEPGLEAGGDVGGRQKFEKPKSHTHFGFHPASLCWASVEGVASSPERDAGIALPLLHL